MAAASPPAQPLGATSPCTFSPPCSFSPSDTCSVFFATPSRAVSAVPELPATSSAQLPERTRLRNRSIQSASTTEASPFVDSASLFPESLSEAPKAVSVDGESRRTRERRRKSRSLLAAAEETPEATAASPNGSSSEISDEASTFVLTPATASLAPAALPPFMTERSDPTEKKYEAQNMQVTTVEPVGLAPRSTSRSELGDAESLSAGKSGLQGESAAPTAALEADAGETRLETGLAGEPVNSSSEGVGYGGDEQTVAGETREPGTAEEKLGDLKPEVRPRFHAYAEQDVCAWATSMLARKELRKLKAAAVKLEGDRMPRSDVVGLYFKKHRPCWSVDYHTRQGKRKTVEFFVPDLSRETIELVLVHAIECRKYMPRRFDQAPAFVPEPDDTTSGMPYRYGARLLSPKVLAWIVENTNGSGRTSQHGHGQSRRLEGDKVGEGDAGAQLLSGPAGIDAFGSRSPRAGFARQRDNNNSRRQGKASGCRPGADLATSSEEKATREGEAELPGGSAGPGSVPAGTAYGDYARQLPSEGYQTPPTMEGRMTPAGLLSGQEFGHGQGMQGAGVMWRDDPRQALQAMPQPLNLAPHATPFMSRAGGLYDQREASVEPGRDVYPVHYPTPYAYGPGIPADAGAPSAGPGPYPHQFPSGGAGYVVNGRVPDSADHEAHSPRSPESYWGPQAGSQGAEDKDCQVVGCMLPNGSEMAMRRMETYVGDRDNLRGSAAFAGDGRTQAEGLSPQCEPNAKRRRLQAGGDGSNGGLEASGPERPFPGSQMLQPSDEWARNGQRAFAVQPGTGGRTFMNGGFRQPGPEDARQPLLLSSAPYSPPSVFPAAPPHLSHTVRLPPGSSDAAHRTPMSGAAGCASPVASAFRKEAEASEWPSNEVYGSPQAFPDKANAFAKGVTLPRRQSFAFSDAGLPTPTTSPHHGSYCASTIASSSPKSASPVSQSGCFPCDFYPATAHYSGPGVETPSDVSSFVPAPAETAEQQIHGAGQAAVKTPESGLHLPSSGWPQQASVPGAHGAEFYASRAFANGAHAPSLSLRPSWRYPGGERSEGDLTTQEQNAPAGASPSSPVWSGNTGVCTTEGCGVWLENRQAAGSVEGAADPGVQGSACMQGKPQEGGRCSPEPALGVRRPAEFAGAPVGACRAVEDRTMTGERGAWGNEARRETVTGDQECCGDQARDPMVFSHMGSRAELSGFDDGSELPPASPLNECMHPLGKPGSRIFPEFGAWPGSPPHEGSFVQEFDIFKENGEGAAGAVDDAMALWPNGGAFGQRTDPLAHEEEKEGELWKGQPTPFCSSPALWCVCPVEHTREFDVMDMVTLPDLSHTAGPVSRPLPNAPLCGGCVVAGVGEAQAGDGESKQGAKLAPDSQDLHGGAANPGAVGKLVTDETAQTSGREQHPGEGVSTEQRLSGLAARATPQRETKRPGPSRRTEGEL
ncbi:AP2 domain transcription factor AP2IV-2 [Toxoplasma gondii CAST]|uniref:AP2 domain transcription factor AP2IV-2 n=1 Tax=Toxoplasma gondii CAST TaxID=943122 RepID=A0A425HNL6_TOXGO|nr:AP2 domain transcription factor AP2IV-2 [Toxoplasma gondii CAST]